MAGGEAAESSALRHGKGERERLPQLVAFDLDYTLWPVWVDTHPTPPLKGVPGKPGAVQDRYGDIFEFYPEAAAILFALRKRGVWLAACSRTQAPELARQALNIMKFVEHDHQSDVLDKYGDPLPRAKARSEPKSALAGECNGTSFFDAMEIYPGSKLTHFRALHKATGIAYSEMLFFDDESRNREVEKLGVTMQLVPRGFSRSVFEKALKSWNTKVRGQPAAAVPRSEL